MIYEGDIMMYALIRYIYADTFDCHNTSALVSYLQLIQSVAGP